MVGAGRRSAAVATVVAGLTVVGGLVAPASGAPRPVRVSAGVQTPTFTPFVDGVTDRAVLRLRVDRRARVKLVVSDAAGRTVRKKYLGVRAAKRLYRPTWDGRTTGGRLLPTGTYRVRFQAFEDGRRTVSSRTRIVLLQRQRLVDRRTTITVRGADYDPGSSSGVFSDRATFRTGPDGSIYVKASGTPVTWCPTWRTRLPARTTSVRFRYAVTVTSAEGLQPTYGYLGRRAGETRYDDLEFDRAHPDGPPAFDGRWVAASSLASPTEAVHRLVVSSGDWSLQVFRASVDVRYRALVPA